MKKILSIIIILIAILISVWFFSSKYEQNGVENQETVTQAPVIIKQPTEDEIINDFITLRANYRKWFEEYDFNYYLFDNPVVVSGGVKYKVKDSISNKSELDNLFLKYCTEEAYNYYCTTSVVKYSDNGGQLYSFIPKNRDEVSSIDNDITINKLSDTSYEITYFIDYDYLEYDIKAVVLYSVDQKGEWKFGLETRVENNIETDET